MGVDANRFDGKVVIEVRCNEYTMRDHNRHVPWSADEIAVDAADCRDAGASIVHFHTRDRETGAMRGGTAAYAEVIRAVRAKSDVLLNPTLGASTIPDPMDRVRHIPELGDDPATRPDLAPVDLGSFNVDPFDWDRLEFRADDIAYRTTVRGLRHEIAAITSAGVGVQSVLWNVGSARCLGAFLAMGALPSPAFAQIMLSDTLLSTHPGTVRGLQALVDFLPAGVHWSTGCVGGNLLRLVATAVEMGGHISIGLGDYPYRELGEPTNAQVVAEVVRMVRACGREPATPDEVREVLALGA